MAVVKSEKRVMAYSGIENLFTPDVFFNLLGWTDRECHTERAIYAISDFHYSAGEGLSSILGTEKFGNITRAVVSIGILSLARFYGIADKQIERIVKDSDGKGFELLKKEIEGICSCKNIQMVKVKEELMNIVNLYGSNRYNNVLCIMLQAVAENKENKKIIMFLGDIFLDKLEKCARIIFRKNP